MLRGGSSRELASDEGSLSSLLGSVRVRLWAAVEYRALRLGGGRMPEDEAEEGALGLETW